MIEAERYELLAPPVYRTLFPRRALLRGLGAGLLVVVRFRGAGAQESGRGRGRGRGRGGRGGNQPPEIGAWLHIAEDGAITAYTGKAEVGQDIRTTLTQAVAEELDVPLAAVTMVMADTAATPFDPGTFGSRTTPTMLPQLRRAAAGARAVLLERAAAEWRVPPGEVRAAAGTVTHPASGRSIAYGKITRGEKLVAAVAGDSALEPHGAWTVLGKPARKVDGHAVVTGQRRYTSDVKRPGMLWGKVLRPPRFGASLVGVDGTGVRKVAGARVVHDGGFAGVVAKDQDGARRALAGLRAEWKGPDEAPPASSALFEDLRRYASPGSGRGDDGDAGNVEATLGAARHKIQVSYTAAYIAHAPLEPRAAVAEWNGGKLTVWTGSQRPFGVRGELAEAFGLKEDEVRVVVPDTGAGYGGKHTGEAAVEAARLARAAGAPVKVVWTREEELTWAYFRPAGVIDIRAGMDAGGHLVAWTHQNINSGGSALRSPYDVPSRKHGFVGTRSPLRQGSYRALAATFNNFARESAMDELAALAKMDPLAFRQHNLRDDRLRAVLVAAAERFGWGAARSSAEVGYGLGCGIDKGGYVATCAEVRITGGAIRVARAAIAFECGPVINPDVLRNQVEGAVIMGIGGALLEAVDFADGRITNAAFSRYRVPRFSDAPKLETVLLDRHDRPPAGAGESPIIAIAPAIGNAVFAATGQRLRGLPMRLAG